MTDNRQHRKLEWNGRRTLKQDERGRDYKSDMAAEGGRLQLEVASLQPVQPSAGLHMTGGWQAPRCEVSDEAAAGVTPVASGGLRRS